MSQMAAHYFEDIESAAGSDPGTANEPVATWVPSGVLAPTRSGLYQRVGKRWLDIFASGILLFVLLPLLAAIWSVLRWRLGPHVLLEQRRVGRGGKPFGLLKFRTMKSCRRGSGADLGFIGDDRRTTHKSDGDPRHTRIGKLVRRFSLDELPQLINVFRGDMSLVGPRPELSLVASAHFLAHERHEVRPGLTGPFQTSDLRGSGDLSMGLDLDSSYVQNVGLLLDVRYLLGTFGALRQGTGS